MSPTTRYKSGDIILVPFPFTDLATVKQRPALVISSEGFNRRQSDLVVLAITSKLRQAQEADEYIVEERERKEAGLLYPSAVKLGKVVAIDQRLVRKLIGKLSRKTARRIISEFKMLLG